MEIKLPKEINYAEAYLTLRCNLNCDYCINNVGGVERKRKELSADEWLNGLNQINFGKIPLTLGGGEPTMHHQFYDILDGLNSLTKIDLLTHLMFNIDEFIKRASPDRFTKSSNSAYRSIRASYHVTRHNPRDLIKRARKLQDAGFSIGIFGLTHPANAVPNMQMAELARQEQVLFIPKDFLGRFDGKMIGHYKYPEGLDGKLKTVKCRSKELLISPEGNIHKCHRDLYRNEYPIGNIRDDFKIEHKFRLCSNYGECNPCDMKLKTNQFLDKIDCQVEIKNISVGCRDRGYTETR